MDQQPISVEQAMINSLLRQVAEHALKIAQLESVLEQHKKQLAASAADREDMNA